MTYSDPKNQKNRMDHYTIFIASRYFESLDDFINLELGVKRFYGNMTKFFYNPISLSQDVIDFFPKVETIHLYNKEDEFIIDDVVKRFVIWYPVTYSESQQLIQKLNDKMKENIDENSENNEEIQLPIEFKSVTYDQKDKEHYDKQMTNEVTEILTETFQYELITSIQLSTNLKRIEDRCFLHCLQLKHIEIPSSVQFIGNECFADCVALESITFNGNLISIGCNCFRDCTSLKHLNVPRDWKLIGNRMFFTNNSYSNNQILVSFEIPQQLKFVNNYPIQFSPLTELNLCDISPNITIISDCCFFDCNQLTSLYWKKETIHRDEETFNPIKEVEERDVNKIIKSIGKYSFHNCPIDRKKYPMIKQQDIKDVLLQLMEKDMWKQLEEWTESSINEIVFDSAIDDWNIVNPVFGERIFDKKKLVFVVEIEKDKQQIFFGGYLSAQIDQFNEHIADDKAFVFSLRNDENEQKKKLKRFTIKEEKRHQAFKLYVQSGYGCFIFGNDDFTIWKELEQSTIYQAWYSSFDYGDEENALVGFCQYIRPLRIVIIQMK